MLAPINPAQQGASKLQGQSPSEVGCKCAVCKERFGSQDAQAELPFKGQ